MFSYIADDVVYSEVFFNSINGTAQLLKHFHNGMRISQCSVNLKSIIYSEFKISAAFGKQKLKLKIRIAMTHSGSVNDEARILLCKSNVVLSIFLK